MELNYDFDICQVSCDTLKYVDETCFHKYVNPYTGVPVTPLKVVKGWAEKLSED